MAFLTASLLVLIPCWITLAQGAVSVCNGTNQWSTSAGFCYTLNTAGLTWAEAGAACAAGGGGGAWLATLGSASEQQQLETNMAARGVARAWTAGKFESGSAALPWRLLPPCQSCVTSVSSCARPASLVFVLDASGSVSDAMWAATKGLVAKVTSVLDLTAMAVGFVRYSDDATSWSLSNDRATVERNLAGMLKDSSVSGTQGSDLGAGLRAVSVLMVGASDYKLAILLTDGQYTCPPAAVAGNVSALTAGGVDLFPVGLGPYAAANTTALAQLSNTGYTWAYTEPLVLNSYGPVDELVTAFCTGSITQKDLGWVPAPTTTNMFEQGCYQGTLGFSTIDNIAATPTTSFADACFTECFKTNTYAGITKDWADNLQCLCGEGAGSGLAGAAVSGCGATSCNLRSTQSLLSQQTSDVDLRCGAYNQTSVYRRDGGAGHWVKTQPNAYEDPNWSRQFCAAVDTFGGKLFFGDEPCEKKYRFLCELPMSACSGLGSGNPVCDYVTSGTGGSVVRHIGHCYFMSAENNRLGWYQARQACRARAGELFVPPVDGGETEVSRVVIERWIAGEQAKYSTFCNKTWDHAESMRYMWAGLFRRGFFWTNTNGNTGMTDMTYSHFYTGSGEYDPAVGAVDAEPRVFADAVGSCVLVDQAKSYAWRSERCDTQQAYVCMEDLVTTTTTVPTTAAGNTTDPGLGAATTDTGLSGYWIALIVIIIILFLAAIIFIVLCIYYKKANKKESQVTTTYTSKYGLDVRPQAPIPDAGVNMDAVSEHETNSTKGLVTHSYKEGEVNTTYVYEDVYVE